MKCWRELCSIKIRITLARDYLTNIGSTDYEKGNVLINVKGPWWKKSQGR